MGSNYWQRATVSLQVRPRWREVGIQVACLVTHGVYTAALGRAFHQRDRVAVLAGLGVAPVNILALVHHGRRLIMALTGRVLPPGV